MLREIIAGDHLPDYRLSEEPGDILHVAPRAAVIDPAERPRISADALDQARHAAPGWDVHALEAEWQQYWAGAGKVRLRSPDKAFLGWLSKRLG